MYHLRYTVCEWSSGILQITAVRVAVNYLHDFVVAGKVHFVHRPS